MVKQLRIDFPDYTPEEQEADAKKAHRLKVIRHAYLMKVDGEWAHFIVGTRGDDDIDFYGDRKLDEVYYKLSRERPDYTPKVIQNEGLENYLRDRRPEFVKRRNRQLMINFNDNGRM